MLESAKTKGSSREARRSTREEKIAQSVPREQGRCITYRGACKTRQTVGKKKAQQPTEILAEIISKAGFGEGSL